ncbi:hypothetical protein LOD99_12974 [Oopsacas minuta]|uniref:NHL repeat containing protein n=1 Tax=Oopsacas minuta TaxID=111878 RepID=A0AAV7JAK9_9METZ|nr:hypothetical protein LOD99_12974 [Oopsacas minuta]
MATPLDTQQLTNWDEIEYELNTAFDLMILNVNRRRANLLDKMNFLRAECRDMPELIQQMKEQLDSLGSQMSNIAKQFHTQEIELWENGISKYQFVWNADEMNLLLDKLGEIVKFPLAYQNKNVPKLTFGTEPGPGIRLASGFAVDEKCGLIAVGELETESILIYNMAGEFVNTITDNQITIPNSITFGENCSLYISNYHHQSVLKFSSKKNDLSQDIILDIVIDLSQFEYGYISALDFDQTSKRLYGTLEKYHKILIFDTELTLIDIFNPGLQFPQDIKVKNNNIFVLDYSNPCFHIISKLNQMKLFSIISRGTNFKFNSPQLFSLDSESNIFVTDIINHKILMYTPSGQLTQVLFDCGQSKGELFVPAGVHVTATNQIIVLSQNTLYPIQIF